MGREAARVLGVMYGPLTPPVPAGPGDPAAAATSLPPLVQGPPRCFLRCTVSRVLWAAPQPPAVVRLRWWGETSGGTVFQPASRPGQPAGRTSARFAVRCGPRQLAAYLAGRDASPRETAKAAAFVRIRLGREDVVFICARGGSGWAPGGISSRRGWSGIEMGCPGGYPVAVVSSFPLSCHKRSSSGNPVLIYHNLLPAIMSALTLLYLLPRYRNFLVQDNVNL